MVTNGDKGEGGQKIRIFTVTYFLNGPLGEWNKPMLLIVDCTRND